MGQQLFNPPNVRGWVGGRTWISSSTLSARRQLVQYLFQKLREDQLNADELLDYAAAVSEKRDHFFVSDERLKSLADQDDSQVVTRFVDYFLPLGVDNGFRQTLRDYLNVSGANRFQLIRDISITLLQTPEYQLC